MTKELIISFLTDHKGKGFDKWQIALFLEINIHTCRRYLSKLVKQQRISSKDEIKTNPVTLTKSVYKLYYIL